MEQLTGTLACDIDNFSFKKLFDFLGYSRNRDFLKKFNIRINKSKKTITMPDNSILPTTCLYPDFDTFNILVSFLSAKEICNYYNELDFSTVIVMMLNEDCIKNRSLIEFCLVLMTDSFYGQNFIYSLLICLGFNSKSINKGILFDIEKYVETGEV